MTELCDIVIPVWNQPEITRNCFESIARFTNSPYKVIVIDNGSDELTKVYLQESSKLFPSYKLIRYEENMGFVKATNSGLREATAEYICLLNNDTIVTQDWLSEMISVMHDKRIGALNPSSNSWGQWPHDRNVQEYAKSLLPEKGKWQETGYCIGFCMMIRKKYLQEIGYLDESFGVGYLEETDFCRRLQSKGYLCARSKAAYVFHLGGESFKKIANSRLMFENNLKLFNKKWGKSIYIAFILNSILADGEIDKINKTMLAACRDSHNVVVYFSSVNSKSIFCDHASLREHNFRKALFSTKVFSHILSRQLKKKKGKDYKLVIVKSGIFYYFLKVLGKISGFKVLRDFDLLFAQNIWREISKKEALT